jgi:hypothetical protein
MIIGGNKYLQTFTQALVGQAKGQICEEMVTEALATYLRYAQPRLYWMIVPCVGGFISSNHLAIRNQVHLLMQPM